MDRLRENYEKYRYPKWAKYIDEIRLEGAMIFYNVKVKN